VLRSGPYPNRQVEQSESPVLGHLRNVGYALLKGSQTSQADYGSPGRMKPKQMILPSDGIFHPQLFDLIGRL
jgi:hypothetical protein